MTSKATWQPYEGDADRNHDHRLDAVVLGRRPHTPNPAKG
jgi:hypothetical protein